MNLRKVAAFAIGPIGSAALTFATLPMVAWIYSAEDIGRLTMLQVASNFCILFFSLGLDQVYVREYHEEASKAALLRSAMFPGLILLLLALSIGLFIPGLISHLLFDLDSQLASLLLALCFVLNFLSRFLSLILRMQERGLAYSSSQLLPKLIFLLVIVAYISFSAGAGILGLLVAHTISIAAVCLILAWNTRAEWWAACRQPGNYAQLSAMLRFGLPLVISGVAYWGLTTMDRLFLRSYASFDELGIYAVATSFAGAALIFQSVFSTIWAPIVYKWSASGIDVARVDQVTEWVLGAIVLLFALAGLFSVLITFLLPAQYERVQYLLVACMGYPLFYTLSETTVVGLGIARKSLHAMLASLFGLLCCALANYLLVPIWGAGGAAIASASGFWLLLIARTELSIRVWRPLPRFQLYAWTFVCLALAAAFVLFGAQYGSVFMLLWLGLLACAGLRFGASFKREITAMRRARP